jgi:hypothetical protein
MTNMGFTAPAMQNGMMSGVGMPATCMPGMQQVSLANQSLLAQQNFYPPFPIHCFIL